MISRPELSVTVKPSYGWGWVDANGGSVEVPSEFELVASSLDGTAEQRRREGLPPRSLVGRVTTDEEHALAGLWVRLTARHAEEDATYNLACFEHWPTDGEQAYVVAGYASALLTRSM